MSLTIIDGTKPPSPLYVREPKPDFKLLKHPQVEIQRHYDIWFQRWKEGYKGLTGPHVFYIQEITLKDIFGNEFHPYWRDLDSMVFDQIKDCMTDGWDGLWYKARDKGVTSIFGAGMTFWFARMYPGVKINLSGKDTTNIVNMYNDKIITAYQNMDPMIINPVPVNINQTKEKVYLKFALKQRMADGEVRLKHVELNLVESSESDASAAKFSGTRSPYSYIDEAPLHKRIAKVIRSSEATRMAGATKAGFLAMGGTVEDTLNQEDLRKFQQLINDAKTKGIKTFFIPAWMGLPEYSVNGWSNEKEGTEWVLRRLEEKEQSSDPNDALAWRKNYPLTEEDIFNLSEGDGAFEKDVIQLLDHTHQELIKSGVNEEVAVKLINRGGEVESVPDKVKRGDDDGGFWMIEPPEDGQKYYQTIDGAASGKEDGGEEGSWIAATIYKDISLKGDHYAPVCHYFERPNRLEDGYRNMVTQYRYYNKFDGMIHINYETAAGLGGNFGSYLDAEGLFKAIMQRKDLTAKGNIPVNKLGTAVDEHIKDNLYRRGNIFLRRFGHFIKSRMMLSSLLLPKGTNADLRSNFLIFMASIAGWDKPKKVIPTQQFRSIVKLVKNADGKILPKIIKIPVTNAKMHPQDLSEITAFQMSMEKKYGAYWYQKSNQEERQKYLELKGNPNPQRHGSF